MLVSHFATNSLDPIGAFKYIMFKDLWSVISVAKRGLDILLQFSMIGSVPYK